ncbi:MAG: J domain-containing protein [Clostridia bacterium]|nr:J domain-containing protein [Clostridia bacterium]
MDPYKVLGVSPSASDDEIKQAYRALAKKYHPDNYANNPVADLAAEKMKEINAAYEKIQEMRKGGASSADGGASWGNTASTSYAAIRNQISYGNIDRAEEMLNAIPETMRGGEWHFCMGSVCYRRGWFDRAAEHFQTAANSEPSNREYAAAAERMDAAREVYRERGGNFRGDRASTACDCCSSLLCADCLCECMGGDIIPCC